MEIFAEGIIHDTEVVGTCGKGGVHFPTLDLTLSNSASATRGTRAEGVGIPEINGARINVAFHYFGGSLLACTVEWVNRYSSFGISAIDNASRKSTTANSRARRPGLREPFELTVADKFIAWHFTVRLQRGITI